MSDPICIADYDGVIREVLASGGEFRLYPRGTSMLPLLRQGIDSVSLRLLNAAPKKNDILFYRRSNGAYVLHRVKKVTDSGLVMWGDNQIVLEYGVAQNQIIGHVTRIFRGERELNCQGLNYRMYLGLWQFKIMRVVLKRITYFLRKE